MYVHVHYHWVAAGSGPVLVGAGVTYSESRFIANGGIPIYTSGICDSSLPTCLRANDY